MWIGEKERRAYKYMVSNAKIQWGHLYFHN